MTKRIYNTTEAMAYLGMKRPQFERHIKPQLKGIRSGTSTLYEVADLDKAWEKYKLSAGNERQDEKGAVAWGAQKLPVSKQPAKVITLTNGSINGGFAKMASQILSQRKHS